MIIFKLNVVAEWRIDSLNDSARSKQYLKATIIKPENSPIIIPSKKTFSFWEKNVNFVKAEVFRIKYQEKDEKSVDVTVNKNKIFGE